MVATPVEDEIERGEGRRIEHIGLNPLDRHPSLTGAFPARFKGGGSQIDGRDIEALTRQVDRVHPRPAAKFQYPARRQDLLLDATPEFAGRPPRVPGRTVVLAISCVPTLDQVRVNLSSLP